MRFHDEVVSAADLDMPTPSQKPSAREVRMPVSSSSRWRRT
jgi:hypothetical protein